MSKDVGLWGKFDEAQKCLEDMAGNPDKDFGQFAFDALSLFTKAQKIYFPSDRRILAGRKIDESVADLIKLPFPVTAILTDIKLPVGEEVKQIYSGDLKEFNSYSLVLAFEPANVPTLMKSEIPIQEGTVCFIPMLEIPKQVREDFLSWALVPMLFIISRTPGEIYTGLDIRGAQASKKFNNDSACMEEGMASFDTLINTCAILNLENVTTETHKAPTALNNARIRRGKQPYYDYKVLVVDNERWDAPTRKSSHSERDGVRSHFRRGHIRRLETGKAVWVRHTIVQGSKEGFVEKSYSLEHKNAVHKVSSSL